MDRLDELMGKGSIDKIGMHHRQKIDAAPLKSNERKYHSIARNRAQRIKNTIIGKSHIGPPKRSDTLMFNKSDRKKQMTFKEDIGNVLIQKDHATHETRSRVWPGTAIEYKMKPVYHTSKEAAESHVKSLKNKYGADSVHCVMKGLTEDVNKSLGHSGRKKLSTFERLQRKTRNYLINRDNNIARRIEAGHDPADIAKDMNLHPAVVTAVAGAHKGRNLAKEEVVNEISSETKRNYANKARKDFDVQADKRWTSEASDKTKSDAIRKMGNRAKGIDKTRNEETVTEEHKVIASYEPKRKDGHFKGEKFEVHAHNVGHKSEWHSIIKTHQRGKSTTNEWGGHSPVNVGSPKHIARKWSQLKKHYDDPRVQEVRPFREGQENAFAKLAKKITNKSLNLWLKAHQTPTFGGIQAKSKGTDNGRSPQA